MNDLTQLSYRILFLGLLTVLVTLSVPVPAQETEGVSGTTPIEDRGAVSPLPVPDSASAEEKSIDESPADEVRSSTTAIEPDEFDRDLPTPAAPGLEPSAGPQGRDPADESYKKPWWKFW